MEILEVKYVQNREETEKTIFELCQKKGNLLDEYETKILCESYNALSQILFNEKKIQESFECLRKSESLAVSHSALRASVYNAMASFYRKQGKCSTALTYIEKSLSLCASGNAYLNMCSVLSLQGKYEKSLEIAMHAIIFMQDELFEEFYEGKKMEEVKLESLSAGYYNLAVQLEYLKRPNEANSYYKKSLEFSTKYLPLDSAVHETLKQIYYKIIVGSLNKLESKGKSETNIKPSSKKRVIIKNVRSKSPISKTPPPESSKKLLLTERFQHKIVGPMLNHRKFVQTGVAKSKMIEGVSRFLDKDEGSFGEDIARTLASTQGFTLNNNKEQLKEISLKDKLKIEKILDANNAGKEKKKNKRKGSFAVPTKKIRIVDGSSIKSRASNSNSASDCGEFLKEVRASEHEININPAENEIKSLEKNFKSGQVNVTDDSGELPVNKISVTDLVSSEDTNKDLQNNEKSIINDFNHGHVMEGLDTSEDHNKLSHYRDGDTLHENCLEKLDEIRDSRNHCNKPELDENDKGLENHNLDGGDFTKDYFIQKEEENEENLKYDYEIDMNVLDSIGFTIDHKRETEEYRAEDQPEEDNYEHGFLATENNSNQGKKNHIVMSKSNNSPVDIMYSREVEMKLQEEDQEYIKDLHEIVNNTEEDKEPLLTKQNVLGDISEYPPDELYKKSSLILSSIMNKDSAEEQQNLYNSCVKAEKNEPHTMICQKELRTLSDEIRAKSDQNYEKRRKSISFSQEFKSNISFPRLSVGALDLKLKLPVTPTNSPVNNLSLGEISEKNHESSYSSEYRSEDNRKVPKKLTINAGEIENDFILENNKDDGWRTTDDNIIRIKQV